LEFSYLLFVMLAKAKHPAGMEAFCPNRAAFEYWISSAGACHQAGHFGPNPSADDDRKN